MKPIKARIDCRQVAIAQPCPKHWHHLPQSPNRGERFCASCGETVYLCADRAQLAKHVEQGHCVAIVRGELPDGPPPARMKMVLGRGHFEHTPSQESSQAGADDDCPSAPHPSNGRPENDP